MPLADDKSGAPNNRELYALLHISPEATDEEIRKAYRQWAQIYHPDKYQAPHVLLFLLFLFFNSTSAILNLYKIFLSYFVAY